MVSASSGYILISIHAPRGGSDMRMPRKRISAGNFNPRSPWGERRRTYSGVSRRKQFQSTLPVGGATLVSMYSVGPKMISIHAPRGGSDMFTVDKFLGVNISIHAPRGGSDSPRYIGCTFRQNFNPRSPWGERPVGAVPGTRSAGFQSTLPVGGATLHSMNRYYATAISIHAPRGGSDSKDAQFSFYIFGKRV